MLANDGLPHDMRETMVCTAKLGLGQRSQKKPVGMSMRMEANHFADSMGRNRLGHSVIRFIGLGELYANPDLYGMRSISGRVRWISPTVRPL